MKICCGGGSFEELSTLNNFNRAGFIGAYENWNRYDFKAITLGRMVQSLLALNCSCPLTGDLTGFCGACVCGCMVNATAATCVYHYHVAVAHNVVKENIEDCPFCLHSGMYPNQ